MTKYEGGVCRSDDGGKSWTKSNGGMDPTAATRILLDPTSPVNARVIYVTGFGRGVYKSVDGGRTWKLKNEGITQAEPFAWRLARSTNGTLLFSSPGVQKMAASETKKMEHLSLHGRR